MNYSNSSVAFSEAQTGTETKRTVLKILERYAHEEERHLVRQIPALHGSTPSVHAHASADQATFRQDGEVWTLSYEQKTVRLRDTKGLAYIARLLSQPDTEIHSIELARMAEAAGGVGEATMQIAELENIGVNVGYLGNAGEMLDKQAREAYRRRLSELRDVQAEARALAQVDRAEAAEVEIDSLIAELSRATGLGGRSRVAASTSERARQSVTRAIKSALNRIVDRHPALAQVLARQIKTGTYCSYQPDPNCTIRWSLAASDSDAVSSMADRPAEQMTPRPVSGESADGFPIAQVLGFIFEPPSNAQRTKAESEDALVALDQITSAIRGAFLQLSPQLNPSTAMVAANVILLAVNSAPLLESMGSWMKQSREMTSGERRPENREQNYSQNPSRM